MTTGDVKENEMVTANDFQYVRAISTQGSSVNVNKPEFVKIMNSAELIYLEAGEEIEIYPNLYGLYQVDDYSSGATAIYLANYNGTSLIHSLGGDFFGVSQGSKTFSLYKKGGNTPLFLSNNANERRSVGFKRL